MSRRTVARWRDWWCSVFTDSPFWRAHGAFVPPVTTADLPASLLQSFDGEVEQQLHFAVALPRADHDGARDFAGYLTGGTGPQKK